MKFSPMTFGILLVTGILLLVSFQNCQMGFRGVPGLKASPSSDETVIGNPDDGEDQFSISPFTANAGDSILGPVTGLQVTSSNNGIGQQISWTAPAGGSPTGYRVVFLKESYSRVYNTARTDLNVPTDVNLADGDYNVRVRAVYGTQGTSDFVSTTISVRSLYPMVEDLRIDALPVEVGGGDKIYWNQPSTLSPAQLSSLTGYTISLYDISFGAPMPLAQTTIPKQSGVTQYYYQIPVGMQRGPRKFEVEANYGSTQKSQTRVVYFTIFDDDGLPDEDFSFFFQVEYTNVDGDLTIETAMFEATPQPGGTPWGEFLSIGYRRGTEISFSPIAHSNRTENLTCTFSDKDHPDAEFSCTANTVYTFPPDNFPDTFYLQPKITDGTETKSRKIIFTQTGN